MDDERKEYLKQYKKENLKRISLDVNEDFYDQVKLAAKIDGVSVSNANADVAAIAIKTIVIIFFIKFPPTFQKTKSYNV